MMRYLTLLEVLELHRQIILAVASGKIEREAFVEWLEERAIAT